MGEADGETRCNWLRHAWYNFTNVILADEMGLGKTVQVRCSSKASSQHNSQHNMAIARHTSVSEHSLVTGSCVHIFFI